MQKKDYNSNSDIFGGKVSASKFSNGVQKKGITLLLAILISSAASLLSLGVFMIIFGELGISTASKESMKAFYAADTGVECSLYYDLVVKTTFATSTYAASPASFTVNCNGSSVTGTYIADGIGGGTFSYSFTVTGGSSSCSTVTVTKMSGGQTIVDAFGENIADCNTSNSRVIQRGLEVAY